VTDEERQRIRSYARALAEQHAREAPLSPDQRDRLRMLFRPEPAAPEARVA
jgi:hypothetical protein